MQAEGFVSPTSRHCRPDLNRLAADVTRLVVGQEGLGEEGEEFGDESNETHDGPQIGTVARDAIWRGPGGGVTGWGLAYRVALVQRPRKGGSPVQILESSIFGLRSVRLTLQSPDTNVTVTLFPMIHMAEPGFYEAVYRQAAGQDVVLLEGVKSPVTTRITRAYRWLQGSRRLNLSPQPRFTAPPGSAVRIVQADLSTEEFETAWRTIPLWLRWTVYVLAPLTALRLRLSGSRERLARTLAMDQEPTLEDHLDHGPETAALTEVIMDWRDKRLVEVLGREIDGADGERTIAVVYGASHMRAVLKELTTVRSFAVRDTAWFTVFET